MPSSTGYFSSTPEGRWQTLPPITSSQGVPGKSYSMLSTIFPPDQNASVLIRWGGMNSDTNAWGVPMAMARCCTRVRKKSSPVD